MGEYALFSRVHGVSAGEQFIYKVLNSDISALEENTYFLCEIIIKSLVSFIGFQKLHVLNNEL